MNKKMEKYIKNKFKEIGLKGFEFEYSDRHPETVRVIMSKIRSAVCDITEDEKELNKFILKFLDQSMIDVDKKVLKKAGLIKKWYEKS